MHLAPPARRGLRYAQNPSVLPVTKGHVAGSGKPGPVILIDGRLDHRQRLASELGLNPKAEQDTDLVRAAYERWDADWIEHIHGTVAVIIIDTDRKRLLACRDELGRVPLYYHLADDCLLLGSSPATLLRYPALDPARDRDWLAWYFGAMYSEVGHRSPFAAIRQLLPNQTLIWDAGDDTVEFRLARNRLGRQRIRFLSEEAYDEGFRERLGASIADRTRGIDRMGILLSGGMDSCPVGCLAAEQFRSTGQGLTAYSWTLKGFPEADESSELSLCAEFAGIPTVLLPGDDLLPFTDPLNEPVDINSPVSNAFWRLFDMIYRRAAAEGCRILLQGTFGDRLYPYGWEVADALSDGQWALAGQELRRQWRRLGWLGLITSKSTRNAIKRLLGVSRLRRPKAPEWLSPEAAARLDFELWPLEGERHPRPEQHRALLGPRLFERSVGHRVDQTAQGIYRLDPFHDWDLIDYMLAIPAYQSRRLGQTKYLTRNAMRGLMPECLRTRSRGSLLSSFFDAGFDRARPEIEAFLAQPDCTWPEYLVRERVLGTLRDPKASGLQRVLVHMALSYELWNRKLAAELGRPGLFSLK